MPEPCPFARPLSPRLREILRLKLAGRSNREIAAELVVSESTVSCHVDRLRVAAGLEDAGRGWLVVLACRYTAWQCGQGGE